MKKLIILSISAASLLALSTSGGAKHSFKNISSINDTLPPTDTMGGNGQYQRKDTFGGIPKNINDTTQKMKKDSSFLKN